MAAPRSTVVLCFGLTLAVLLLAAHAQPAHHKGKGKTSGPKKPPKTTGKHPTTHKGGPTSDGSTGNTGGLTGSLTGSLTVILGGSTGGLTDGSTGTDTGTVAALEGVGTGNPEPVSVTPVEAGGTPTGADGTSPVVAGDAVTTEAPPAA